MQGETEHVIDALSERMRSLAAQQRFEEAASVRDRLSSLLSATTTARLVDAVTSAGRARFTLAGIDHKIDQGLVDLDHLGVDTASIKPLKGAQNLVDTIRNAPSPAVLMGIYYVFEGSKNGARFIARALGKAWGKTDLEGMKYLDPHGDAQRGLWMKFREDMNAVDWSSEEQDVMVKAAQDTFDAISALDDEIHVA